MSTLVDLRIRSNRILMLPESIGDFDAGDPNDLMHWMEAGHGLCIFDRRDNPMISPPRDHFTQRWNITQIIEYLRDPPPPKPICCSALKDTWAMINNPPINYDMTPEGLDDAGHHEDPEWEEHHGMESIHSKGKKAETAQQARAREANEQFDSIFTS